ncbi:MAG: translesion DNA synthesis-associated protein ImuA [Rubrivivax sp.]
MSFGFPTRPPHPEQIHPELWRAHQLGGAARAVRPTGFGLLDGQLPGGGWPCGALTELLLAQPGVGEMRLLAPVMAVPRLADVQALPDGSSVMLFGPPAVPCAQALQQMGVDLNRLIVVQGREGARGAAVRHLLTPADLLWALEQALRSGQVGVVLAWLPERLAAGALRRLQLAAQAHEGPAFMLRGMGERCKPSPAPLRLALHPGRGPDEIAVQVLKRRGPAAGPPVRLSLPPVLPAAARRRWSSTSLASTSSVDRPSPAVLALEAGLAPPSG